MLRVRVQRERTDSSCCESEGERRREPIVLVARVRGKREGLDSSLSESEAEEAVTRQSRCGTKGRDSRYVEQRTHFTSRHNFLP